MSKSLLFTLLPPAVERNNLMRLSQSIPFTPVPPRGENTIMHQS